MVLLAALSSSIALIQIAQLNHTLSLTTMLIAKPTGKWWTVVNEYFTKIQIHIHCKSLTCSRHVSAGLLWAAIEVAAAAAIYSSGSQRCRCSILADGAIVVFTDAHRHSLAWVGLKIEIQEIHKNLLNPVFSRPY